MVLYSSCKNVSLMWPLLYYIWDFRQFTGNKWRVNDALGQESSYFQHCTSLWTFHVRLKWRLKLSDLVHVRATLFNCSTYVGPNTILLSKSKNKRLVKSLWRHMPDSISLRFTIALCRPWRHGTTTTMLLPFISTVYFKCLTQTSGLIVFNGLRHIQQQHW